MFYFLVAIGISLMVYGIYKEKDNLSILVKESPNKIELNELNRLSERIENIEKILFFSDDFEAYLNEENEILKKDNEVAYEEVENTISQNSIEKYKMILKYEKENHSLEEICSLLDMKKGEVLLLKNLYKTYKI